MLRTRKGEGYIDTVVLVLIFTMLVVVLLQLFSAVFLSQKLHAVAEETARYAAACGEIGAGVTTYFETVCTRYGLAAELSFVGSVCLEGSEKVQLGDVICVTVTAKPKQENGWMALSASMQATYRARSVRYWKAGDLS